MPDGQFLAHGAVDPGGPVDKVVVVLPPALAALPHCRGAIVPVTAVDEFDYGPGYADFRKSVQQEASGIEIDGRGDGAVLVHYTPAVLCEVTGVTAHMVAVIVGNHHVIDPAAGDFGGEVAKVAYDDVAA